MRTFLTRAVTLLTALLMAATVSAQTQGLERVGPTSPSNGFPLWYQDKTGVALEFCSPTNALELEGGWCLLLPGDTVVPETFPTTFADEHFFFAADSSLPAAPGLASGAILVIGLEAAFAVGPVVNGDQIVFARVRVRFDAEQTGVYTIRHPYGTLTLSATAGERVFYTEDIGITCQGRFDCALNGKIGPFLLASTTPGGAELPAVPGPVPGKLYIADPARDGPVTGSPFNQNFFQIVAPNGTVLGTTNNFTLMGRIFNGVMGGRVNVEKARYGRAAGSLTGNTDVFATAFSTTQPRLPGGTIGGSVTPVLGFYPSACGVSATGALIAPAGTARPMFRGASRYYGQTTGAIPAAVCVVDFTARDQSGANAPSYAQANVVDQVTVLRALYDPANGGTLNVAAMSSDQNLRPILTPSLGAPLANQGDGTAAGLATNIVVPPLMLAVSSAAGGRAELEVSTLIGQPTPPNTPFASNDSFTVAEDSVNVALNVLANDSVAGLPVDPAAVTIAIKQAPALGNAVVSNGTIVYTPFPNRFGPDVLTYTVANAAGESDQAFVSITIPNTNDAPVATNDAANGVAGIPITLNLIANDTDPDGQADIAGVQIVSAPVGLTYTLNGGMLTLSALAGTYTFTYRARDAVGALSLNTATATVILAGGETLAITRAEFIANKRRWRIEGTSSVPATQTVFLMYADGVFADGTSAVGFLVATTQSAAGLWTVDMTLAGTNDPRNPAGTAFFQRPTRIYAISDLGGNSPTTLITVR
jgi:hypothetical protein